MSFLNKFIFLFILSAFLLYPQPGKTGVGIGIALAPIEYGTSIPIGITISALIDSKVYVDIVGSTNSGKGSYLVFKSNKTKLSKDISWLSFSAGYMIKIQNTHSYVTPTVGLVFKHDIYEDPIVYDTWFYEKAETLPTIGVLLITYMDKTFLSVGLNTYELFKINVGVNF